MENFGGGDNDSSELTSLGNSSFFSADLAEAALFVFDCCAQVV
jgi:hypothetical protein